MRDDIHKKKFIFNGHCPLSSDPPPSPNRARWSFFPAAKNDVLARITEPSNDEYDNDVSDNCDDNFGTFDDFGVENNQKVYTYHDIGVKICQRFFL